MNFEKQIDAIKFLRRIKDIKVFTAGKGFPDRMIKYKNVVYFCEIKTRGTKATASQLEFLKGCKNSFLLDFNENKCEAYYHEMSKELCQYVCKIISFSFQTIMLPFSDL